MKKIIIILLLIISNTTCITLKNSIQLKNYHWMTDEIREAIIFNSEQYDLKPELIASIINRESSGNIKAIGKAGEHGLMQPLTIHYRGNPKDLFIPMINLKVGCRYLKRCKIKSKGDIKTMVRLYNQGLNGKSSKYKNWKYVNDILKDLEV